MFDGEIIDGIGDKLANQKSEDINHMHEIIKEVA